MLKMSNPSISIIIPAYNVGQWIDECLDSIAGQSWPDIECIIVDDNSTDNTWDIARKSIESYTAEGCSVQFRILHHEHNRGVSAARNTGLKIAKGTYIWFVDPDDYIADGAVFDLIHKLDNHTPDVIFFSHATFFDSKKNKIYRLYPVINRDTYSDILYSAYAEGKGTQTLWNRIILRKTLVSNNLWFDETLVTGEDQDLQIRMADLPNLTIDFNSRCCYFKRNCRQGAFSNSRRRAMTGSLALVGKYIHRINDEDHGKKKLFHSCIATWINSALTLIAMHRAADRRESIIFINKRRKDYSSLLIESGSGQYKILGKALKHSVQVALLVKKIETSKISRAIALLKTYKR